MNIGILAFGSLRDMPGPEIQDGVRERIPRVTTPFPVEFARQSNKRGGAPTLVPHRLGGPVLADLLVMDPSIGIEDAKNRLWRREIGTLDRTRIYVPSPVPHKNKVRIQEIRSLSQVSIALYTDFDEVGKISPLSAEILADMAIKSVRLAPSDEDGISYLINAINQGTVTPLTRNYELAILQRMKSKTLAGALSIARKFSS